MHVLAVALPDKLYLVMIVHLQPALMQFMRHVVANLLKVVLQVDNLLSPPFVGLILNNA